MAHNKLLWPETNRMLPSKKRKLETNNAGSDVEDANGFLAEDDSDNDETSTPPTKYVKNVHEILLTS